MAQSEDFANTVEPYQLYYFPIPGRAEASRVVLSLANLSWKDNEINFEEYGRMKHNGELPWGMVPMLRTPDGVLAESAAILRYIGNMA